MIAAVYARKSTDQNVSDEEKSVTRQVERATAYAERKGWTVSEESVFTDDGISGGEFLKRHGFLALMNALRPRPPFEILIVMDQSRLGRSQDEIPYAVKKITDAGVRVWSYLSDAEIKRATAADKFMVSAIAFVDEMAREPARERTRDAMRRKAERGHVAGGRVYGYVNEEIATTSGPAGQRVRDHVELRIHADQADVIRRIFGEAAGGRGFARIAKGLNAEGIPCPARGRGWASTGVREILHRDLYRGRLTWGRTRWVDRGGTKVKEDRPASEWVVVDAPALRIVTEEAWAAAHARLEQTRSVYRKAGHGALWGRPEAIAGGHGVSYLLSGLLLCGECGWGLHATNRTSRRGASSRYYVCTAHRTRGDTVCGNRYSAPMDGLHGAVVESIKRDILSPDLVRDVIQRALDLRAGQPEAAAEWRASLLSELERLERELRRYAEAIGAGEPLPSILEAMRTREHRRLELQAQLAGWAAAERPEAVTPATVHREIARRLTDWPRAPRSPRRPRAGHPSRAAGRSAGADSSPARGRALV